MKQLQWTFVDKTEWPRGEWDREPDKLQWMDEATGLPCLVHRGPSGSLCGYVGVSEGHPAFEKEYDSVECGENGPDVHGGLTFSSFCAETVGENGRGICHLVEPGEPERVWWLGFDCAHSGDFCPEHGSRGGIFAQSAWEEYRSLSYVQWQCRKLAAQLAAMEPQ